MRIAHLVTGLCRANGVTVFVENVVRELNTMGLEAKIFTPADAPADMSAFDVVHLHGLWHPWLHRQAAVARKCGKKIVWSPHGMLTPWAMHNHWWKKIIAWFLYQKHDLAMASAIHVTALSEVEDVRRLGFKNKLIMAPLGVAIAYAKREKRAMKTLLFVSRVQRKKGLPMLFRAWANLPEALKKRWRIRIVGPDQEGHTDELQKLARKLGISDSIEFTGPRYGQELKNTYADADCFVLPSYSENFGSVVIESLASGVPVITTKGTPWEDLVSHQCGWWTEISEAGIEQALREAMTLTENERREMGTRGRKLVEEKYTWPAVANAMVKGYAKSINEDL